MCTKKRSMKWVDKKQKTELQTKAVIIQFRNEMLHKILLYMSRKYFKKPKMIKV